MPTRWTEQAKFNVSLPLTLLRSLFLSALQTTGVLLIVIVVINANPKSLTSSFSRSSSKIPSRSTSNRSSTTGRVPKPSQLAPAKSNGSSSGKASASRQRSQKLLLLQLHPPPQELRHHAKSLLPMSRHARVSPLPQSAASTLTVPQSPLLRSASSNTVPKHQRKKRRPILMRPMNPTPELPSPMLQILSQQHARFPHGPSLGPSRIQSTTTQLGGMPVPESLIVMTTQYSIQSRMLKAS